LLGYYVEGIASANPANAEAIILGAGMDVRGKGGTSRVALKYQPLVTLAKFAYNVRA